jgi:hypothetical protein
MRMKRVPMIPPDSASDGRVHEIQVDRLQDGWHHQNC